MVISGEGIMEEGPMEAFMGMLFLASNNYTTTTVVVFFSLPFFPHSLTVKDQQRKWQGEFSKRRFSTGLHALLATARYGARKRPLSPQASSDR